MNGFSALKPIFWVALIGFGLAALSVFVYCFLRALPYANSGDGMFASERADRIGEINLLGAFVFAFFAGPIAANLGVVGGTITYLFRRR